MLHKYSLCGACLIKNMDKFSLFFISDCKYSCHVKCLVQVCRVCAHVKASENPAYIADICPELGLSAQAYRCAECKAHITFSKYHHTCKI
jgi:hypothetical protein